MLPLDFDVLWTVRQTWEAGQGRSYRPADVWVFWLVESGAMRLTVDGVPYTVTAGEACLQFPGVMRELQVMDTVTWVSVAFRSKVRATTTGPVWQWRPGVEEGAVMRMAFDQLAQSKTETGPGTRWRRDGAGRLLLGLCLEHAPQAAFPAWLQSALARLESEPHVDISVLAAECGYSTSQFRVLFRQFVGTAPADYGVQCLATRARALVLETDWAVKRIANELDFATPSHFCRFFKRRFGVSPLEFRREAPPV